MDFKADFVTFARSVLSTGRVYNIEGMDKTYPDSILFSSMEPYTRERIEKILEDEEILHLLGGDKDKILGIYHPVTFEWHDDIEIPKMYRLALSTCTYIKQPIASVFKDVSGFFTRDGETVWYNIGQKMEECPEPYIVKDCLGCPKRGKLCILERFGFLKNQELRIIPPDMDNEDVAIAFLRRVIEEDAWPWVLEFTHDTASGFLLTMEGGFKERELYVHKHRLQGSVNMLNEYVGKTLAGHTYVHPQQTAPPEALKDANTRTVFEQPLRLLRLHIFGHLIPKDQLKQLLN